jgi:hypothetical protein
MSDLYEFRKEESKPRVKVPDSEDKHVAMLQATEERRLNSEIEFGFEYNWLGNGYWGTGVAQPINFDTTPKIIRKLI